MAQAVQNQGRTIRVPVYLQELQGQIRKATVELAGDEGAVPSDAALAAKLGISESRVAEVQPCATARAGDVGRVARRCDPSAKPGAVSTSGAGGVPA